MIAIKVENLSKAYQLGEIGTGSLSRDLERWYAKIRGKEDPFLKIGETNDRTVKGTSDVVWSLKDINFEIEQGDAVGIIGRNGAGKSTLLKILSRTTSPTTGTIKARGRIASLLEVGTGFHPELSGRDNIYLNGAILGMRKKEIARKFAEIVDFSGVERYIDTPVKRYSSGMYVRLAFAVAAHLESEILIVDEVLAVGDTEFQKKCISRMQYVAREEGRTILFVSHDLKAIGALCNTCILLKNGIVESKGLTGNIIKNYTLNKSENLSGIVHINKQAVEFIKIRNESKLNDLTVADSLIIELLFCTNAFASDHILIDIGIYNEKGDMIIHSKTKHVTTPFKVIPNSEFTLMYEVEKPNLSPGSYVMTIYVYEENVNKEVLFWIDDVPAFIINSTNPYATTKEKDYLEEIRSFTYPKTHFNLLYDGENYKKDI